MYTRAVNLKVCDDLTVDEYLRSLQLHIFQYGLPQLCVSDLGSQLVSAGNIIRDFLRDHQTQNYFLEMGIQTPEFKHYFKGCSKLGGLVESCVKLTKNLIYKSIKKNVLHIKEFLFLVENANHLINKRPIAFKESLRDTSIMPDVITPEILLHGYNLNSVNVIPNLHVSDISELLDPSYNPSTKIKNLNKKLTLVRHNLIEVYKNEFYSNLIVQATDQKDRYIPVNYHDLNIGDIVLLKGENVKALNYPLARVVKLFRNALNEVTDVQLLKGCTGEIVKRHVSSIIPLLTEQDFS